MEELIGQDSGAPGAVVESSTETFVADVVEGSMEQPVIVDFWAPWCGPCKMVAPILDDLASQYAGRVTIAKVNTDENSQWAMKYGVQGIPTMLFVKDGKEVDRVVGATSAATYTSKIEELLDDSS